MSFLGRYRLGRIVPLMLVTVDSNDAPVLPDQAPSCQVYNGSMSSVMTFKTPIRDRYLVTAFFQQPMILNADFAAGYYTIVYQWQISGTSYSRTDTFRVLAAGDKDGDCTALGLHQSGGTMFGEGASFALMQGRAGRIKMMRNPRSL